MNLRKNLHRYINLYNYVEAYRSNKLPEGYTKLSYIQGDGTAYIDLGISLTQDDSIEIDFIAKYTASTQIFGYRDGASSNNIVLFTGGNPNSVFLDFNNSNYTDYRLSTTITDGSEYKAILNKNIRQLLDSNGDIVVENTTACSDTITTGNVYLFFVGGTPTANNKFTGSIKEVIISGRMDLIPCKDPNNNVGMYDIISGKFFGNVADSGTFVAGDEIADNYLGFNTIELQDAIKDSLKSLKAYGKTELKPDTLLDTVVANGGTEILSHDYIDSIIAKGKTEQRKLPVGYQELEYIESDGSSYIDTGYIPNNETKVKCVVDRPISPVNGYVWYPFTTENDSTNGQFAVFESTNGAGEKYAALTWGKVATSEVVTGTTTAYSKSLFVLQNGVLTYDNNTKTITSPQAGQTFNCIKPITLFKRLGTTSNFVPVRMYSFKLYQDNALMMNLVPAKNASGIIGMYDTVSCTFFTNSGTGSFVAGPEVNPILPPDYTGLEYVTFDGTQVVDTGIICNEESRIESKWIANSSSMWVYGTGATNPRITCYCVTSGNERFGNATVDNTGITHNVLNTVIHDKNGFYYNETNGKAYSNVGTFTCANTLTIGNSNGSTGTAYFNGNFYYMRIYQNDELALNLVPAKRISDSIVGFYDTVSNSFITPNTGTLMAGPSIISPTNPVDIYCNNGVLKARHQSGLPLGYTRLDYLQSDGASYLIVPYRVNNKTVFYCRYNEIQNGLQVASAIFGVTDTPDVSKAYNGILRLSNGTSSFNRMGWGDSTSGSIINVNAPQVLDIWYEVLYDQNKLYQDNVLYATSATSNDTEWVANYDLGIFARNGSSVTMPAIAKISSVWAKENSEYKINLIPARRNSDNVLGMYDLVSGQFFTNASTGNFIAGNIVNDPIEIYTDGIIETINVHGKNLFDYANNKAFVSEGQTVTISFTNPGYRTTVTTDTDVIVMTRSSAQTGYQSETVVIPANTIYLTVAQGYSNASEVQIELGSTATAYQPYFDSGTATVEMLLKVGDYQDEQEILSGTITRNVKAIVLDGTEAWSTSQTYSNVYTAGVAVGKPSGGIVPICNYYAGYSSYNAMTANDYGILVASTATLAIKNKDCADITAFTTWLADQYAAGTPVMVIYPLATAITETVAKQISNKEPGVIEVIAGSLEDLEVINTSSTHTIPSPDYPLDINCNNGILKNGIYGKNLFDEVWQKDKGTSTQQATWGQVVNANGWSVSNLIPVEEGKKYTIAYSTSIGQQYAFYYNADGTMQSNYNSTTVSTLTVTIPSGAEYIRIQCNKSGTIVDNINTQVEQNDSATPYEPYKFGIYTDGIVETIKDSLNNTATCEDLLKVGTYVDTQDILTGLVTHNIGVKVLDGTEDWAIYDSSIPGLVYSDTAITNNLIGAPVTSMICSHLQIDRTTTVIVGGIRFQGNVTTNKVTSGRIYIKANDTWSLAQTTQWLAAQYAAGTPVIIIYPLATATIETVDKQRMRKGIVSITEASMTGLTVDTTESVHTIPSPDFPLDLYCNNGKLSLLDGYTRLDYIKSDGAQYIDTGINQATLVKPRIITKFKFDVNDDKDWFGGSNDNGDGIIWNIAPNLTKVDYIRWKTQAARGITYESGYSKNDLVFRSDFHTLNVGGVEESGDVPVIVDNNLIANMDSTTTLDWVNQNLLIFRSARSGQNGACSFSYFTIYSNDVKVWDGVACRRNSDNVLGMYDLVSGQFFTNKGTGTFTAGNPVILPVSVGTPEKLTVTGKNLYNLTTRTNGYYIDANGNILPGSGTYCYSELIPVKPNTTYTFSGVSKVTNTRRLHAYDNEGNWISQIDYKDVNINNPYTLTGTTPANAAYIRISLPQVDMNIQVEEGTRPTQYEDYMNINCSVEDLLSVGNYQDIEDLKAGITNRKVGIKMLDGTEGWAPSAAANNLFFATISNSSTDNTYIPMSSHFQGVVGSTGYAAMTNGQFKHGSSTNVWYFKNTDCANVTAFSQWLADQCALGTPVIIIYPLATETTESTITQNVDIVSGTNTIERNSEYFDSLGTEVNYKKLR